MVRVRTVAAALSQRFLRDLTARQHVCLTGRAAAGIWALLRAWDFHDRDILLPANTCYIVLWAVLKSGNRPLLVDIDPRTANIDLSALRAVTQSSFPATIIPCHMYGLAAPMSSICDWARSQDIKVIEDSALAIGAMIEGQPAGAWGDAAVFSFGLGKVIDHQVGGAVVTNDSVLAREVDRLLSAAPIWDDRLLCLSNQWHGLYWPLHQYEMSTPQLLPLYQQLYELYGEIAVYRLSQDEWSELPALLRALPENSARRAQQVLAYDEVLLNGLTTYPITTLERPQGSILWKYPLLVPPESRDELLTRLWDAGIHEATRWYPPLRPMARVLAPAVVQPEAPGADTLGATIINLPLGENVDEQSLLKIGELVFQFFEGR
ncbi:MAG: DegT/DnrJ/EryC1/StrS family aminotransferase [Anaerolineae bacterium]